MPQIDIILVMDIDQLKNGSEHAFRQLVEEYSQKVVATCYRFINDKHHAEDVAQEVFFEIYRSISQFRGQSELNTWIYRIAVNKSLDFQRKQKRKRTITDLADFFARKNEKHSESLDPQKILEDFERRDILNAQIQKLPENQKAVIILKQDKSLSNREIAEVLETSESAIEALLYRARQNLRKRLEKIFKNI